LEVSVVSESPFTGIVLFTSHGDANHTTFQCYFRFIFSVFEIVALCYFCTRLPVTTIAQWPLEQQLTFAVVLVAIISNNPLYYYLRVYRPFFPAAVLGSIAPPLFHALVHVSVLVIFDSIAYKNSWPRSFLKRTEIAFGCFFFLTKFLESIGRVFGGPIGPIDVIVDKTSLWLSVTFALWALWFIVGMLSDADFTEAGRTVLYVLAALMVVGCSIEVDVVSRLFDGCEEGLEGSISLFTAQNTFALMMLYLHWPYEPGIDRAYAGSLAGRMLSESESEMKSD
jgi:hypothetical protein